MHVPLRVDFAGGWLDVPAYADRVGRIVNMAIQPLVTLKDLEAGRCAGLGGSAALAILHGLPAVEIELASGAGWQDPAVIKETGLCVWQSGDWPSLRAKYPTEWLEGKLALLWCGPHAQPTAETCTKPKSWGSILAAGNMASLACELQSLFRLCQAVNLSYTAQQREGMRALPEGREGARKYCGSGFGGNALYVFAHQADRDAFVANTPDTRAIEPYNATD